MIPLPDPFGRPSLMELLKAAVELHNEGSLRRNSTARASRSSLIRLAHTAMRLHDAGIAKGVQWPEGKSPLAVAVAALGTAVRNQQQENSND
jgi:hypothetical protein